jgi:hypothetical protein
MSVPFENVDDSILNNMGDLSGMISGQQYQVGSPDQLPEGTNLSGVGDPNVPADIAPLLRDAAQPGQVVVQPGVVPQQPISHQPVPQMQPQAVDDTLRRQLEQQAYNASVRAIEAEEQAFEARIANLSEEEQTLERVKREAAQAKEVNTWLNQKVNGLQRQMTAQEQAAYQRQQESSKNQWGFLTAHQHGLPYENPTIRAALMGAENPEHMKQIAAGLVQLMNQSVQQTSQRQLTNGTLAAGGGAMGPSTPQGPRQRSGDIAGLIASRNPTAVNWG